MINFNHPSEMTFWVGKASFRSWKRLALDRISRLEVENSGDGQMNQENGAPQRKIGNVYIQAVTVLTGSGLIN